MRRLFLGVVLLALGGVVGLRLFLTTEKGNRYLRFLIVQTLSQALGTDVRLRSVRLGGLATLQIHDLSIDDVQCAPLLRVPEMRLSWRPGLFWQGLWKGTLLIPLSNLELHRPQIYLYHERTSGLLNLDRLFPPDTSPSPPSQTPPTLRLPHLIIYEGAFTFRDSTAPDSALLVRKGFMNYAHIQLAHLNLSATIEKHGNRLFAYIRHLSVTDTAAQVKVDTLKLVLRAYPDSTVIDNLYLRTGTSRLQAQGKFLYEGLDKLFLNTDTKQFEAWFKGAVDWRDIAAFSGDSLPLRGLWRIETRMEGDLTRLRWKQLHIETAQGLELETAGEIWHYARPKSLYWDVRVRQGLVSLGGLGAAIPELAGWPKNWDTFRLWNLTGRSIGSLYSYWFQIQLPQAQVLYTMEKTEAGWLWHGKAKLTGWSVDHLVADLPIRELYGEVELGGQGFTWESWTGTAQAALAGLYDTLPIRRLILSAEATSGEWNGELTLQSSLLSTKLQGSVRFAEAPLFRLSGEIQTLSAQLWGAAGRLLGEFYTDLQAPNWDKLQGHIQISRLRWEKPDTTLALSHLSLQVRSDEVSQLQLSGQNLQAQITAHTDWRSFLQEVQAIANAAQGWILDKVPPTLPDTVALSSFSVRLTLYEREAWSWLHLAGVPENLIGGRAQVSFSGSPTSWQLQAEIDSLILPAGALHGIHLQARGQWETPWPFEINLNIAYGEQYLLFQDLTARLTGHYPKGELLLTSRIGLQDSLHWQGEWLWPGGKDFRFRLRPENSTFTLAKQRWTFPEEAVFTLSDSALSWHLLTLSAQARFFTRATPQGIQAQAENLPLRPLLEVLGEDWPLTGLLSFQWEEEHDNLFSLRVDSLSYAGQPYPVFHLLTQPRSDTLPIQFALGSDPEQSLTGTGYYVLTDTTAPLFLRLSGNLPTSWISPFVSDYLEGLGGYFRFSRVIVRGALPRPEIFGDVLLDKARAYIPFLRLSYTADGVLQCRGDTIWAKDLPLYDPGQKLALLGGYIALRAWTAPYLALTLRVREGPVRLLATRPSSDAYLYGQALIEQGELRFTGPWNAVQVQGFVRFAEGTDLTLPVENYLRTEKRSYVRFTGQKDTLRPAIQAPTGLALQVSLLSAPTARFRVLFDSRTGDEIVANGTSQLFLRITPEGEVAISGSYEVTSGEYRLSLRGIVGRTLRIETGSRLTWDGDLYQGRLQITAIYKTFTSLRMIDSTYTATVPVEVRLLLGGTLLSPELRFQVDIPNLTGNPSPLITLFLQRLQNDEQERNRQVFALLALGTFLPPEQGLTATQTSSGVSTTLSEFLSAQLSSLLGQIMGSQVGIGFSMGQWNEISTQVRLSLGGRLTIQREGVLLAPGQTNPTLGNLSARYRILPPRITSPTQLQLEAEAFNRQTFFGGSFGSSTQGLGISLRKSFFLPPSRRKRPSS
ncbi:MAG: translocation/assembly module TamB domain-containing protein [Bacteroidota bacterium]|nr:translocation/assembly module TamB domain-containing protein [Bacteroidota bacterium]